MVFEVPRDYKHALELDACNKNNKWADATSIELAQLNESKTFTDKGKDVPPPSDYKKITVCIIYDVKHNGQHNARLVAGGHLTEVPIESVYSGVVSLRGICLLAFLAELNQKELWGADISSAYFQAKAKEKVYIIAPAEFKDHQGHTLTIFKALYGFKSS